jgi:hypothetical protein
VLSPIEKEDIECGVTVSDSTWMGESVWKALLYCKHAGQWALWLCKRLLLLAFDIRKTAES